MKLEVRSEDAGVKKARASDFLLLQSDFCNSPAPRLPFLLPLFLFSLLQKDRPVQCAGGSTAYFLRGFEDVGLMTW